MSHLDPKIVLFWLSLGLVFYPYVIYPFVLLFLRVFIHRPLRKAPLEPTVSILVPAYNEADVIEAKIRNFSALDYPQEKLELVIASDGSTDSTAAIAQRLSDATRIRTFAYEHNRGKIAVINETIPRVRGEICVFSDASAALERHALRHLVANFADPSVGAVSGTYRVLNPSEARLGKPEDIYWKYETFLKRQESALGCVVGGHGQILAVRTSLYPFPTPDIINDDYVIPLMISKRGYRVVYEPEAAAGEEAREMGGFQRRIRVMAGNIQQMREIKELVWRPQWQLFYFVSHKIMRLAVPFALASLAIFNLLLLSRPLYRQLAIVQLCFYGIALLGTWRRLRPRILRIPYYFCMINAAVFVAVYHMLLERRKPAWK